MSGEKESLGLVESPDRLMFSYKGELTRKCIAQARVQLWRTLEESDGPLVLDIHGVTKVDSAGAALLALMGRELERRNRSLQLEGAKPHIREALDLFPYYGGEPPSAASPSGWLITVGEQAGQFISVLIQLGSILADAAVFLVQGLVRPRTMRWQVVLYEMNALGAQALAVVSTIALLVGATMALQSAAQLRQFGANIFVVDLIGISMTRELGPLMAAIMVAGRSGSAVAAEIGTMVINEEIDALDTMGINPIRFLVVPKLLAISLTQPLLTAMANVAGIFGGFVVATLYLDIGPATFVDRLQASVLLKDLLTGMFKAVIFAQIIVAIGALCGFRTKGGADAVGRSTTTSVVAGIFCVIAADALASLFFYFEG